MLTSELARLRSALQAAEANAEEAIAVGDGLRAAAAEQRRENQALVAAAEQQAAASPAGAGDIAALTAEADALRAAARADKVELAARQREISRLDIELGNARRDMQSLQARATARPTLCAWLSAGMRA